MKRSAALVSVWLACLPAFASTPAESPLGPALPASLPPHPRLLLDARGVAELKERIATATWAKTEWDRIRSPADKGLARPIELPPRGGNWSHHYVCPQHGARLYRGKKIGDWQWEHICPVGKHALRGDPSRASLDFDGNAISDAHGALARHVVDHGLVFQVTGDARHAARAREILLAYAGRYLAYPMHNNQGIPGRGGRVASQSLTEATWLIDILQGADLVWATLDAADRQAIRDKLVMPALNEIIVKGKLGIHNIQCRLNSAIGLAGFLLDDRALIARAIDDPKAGHRQQMEKGVLADGMWTEGSSGYHFFTINGVWPLTEAARHCGLDLYGPEFKAMFDAPLTFAMPNFVLPDFNDSGTVALAGQDDLYELAFARYRNPAYAPLLAQSTRRNRMALLFGVPDLPPGALAPPGSRNSTASGYAILQNGTGTNATWLCLKYGPHGGGHGHPDKNHFILYARGRVVAPDGGTHAYGSPLHAEWDQATFAHNTVVLNETTQQPATGASLAFGKAQEIDYSITDAGSVYKGARLIRTAALLSSNLVVFVDQVQSQQPATIDVVYHQYGAWSDLPTGTPWTPPKVPGYQHLRDAAARPLPKDGLALRVRLADDWCPAVVLATATEPTEIITGCGILKTTEDRVPLLIQRRKAPDTAFAWAIALDGAPVILTTSPVKDATGAALPPGEAILVQVHDGPRARQMLINPLTHKISAPWSTGAPFEVR